MKRYFVLKKGNDGVGPLVYWMSRDQRINDNRALAFAQEVALEHKRELHIVFGLNDSFLGATKRHFAFLLKGLDELNNKASGLNIKFTLLLGDPIETVSKYLNDNNAYSVVVDFDPLKIKRFWKKEVASSIECSMIEVDAHNIIPCRILSNKEEFAAYTIRPKVKKLLPEYLGNIPEIIKHPFGSISNKPLDYDLNKFDSSVGEVSNFIPGEPAATKMMTNFINNKLSRYNELRNDPANNFQSDLSPYLHFGQISAERIAFEVNKSELKNDLKESFLEELIVRRELADNYCFYNKNYDNFQGFHAWAQQSLNIHREDTREFIYSVEQFELAKTHDKYWNAAQLEMVKYGKMHGYMRMYWAKKILEWTKSPEEAQEIAIYLNDRYELDGRDPNGYTGIAWSIGGVHDRAWTERAVFGKIRYMNEGGLKRKFDIERYAKNIIVN